MAERGPSRPGRGLLRDNAILLTTLVVVTAIILRPGGPVPAVSAPGARVALETSRFLITFATAGLLTSFGTGIDPAVRRGFIAALVVLGLTDLWFGVIPNLSGFAEGSGQDTLLPWIAARYLAGILFVLAGVGWPRWSTARLLAVTLSVYLLVESAVVITDTPVVAAVDASGHIQRSAALVTLEMVPMLLFAAGAVLASRLYRRDQQPVERWLASALAIGVFTQIHEAAFPAGLGSVVSSADLLRALSAAFLLTGAVQQVVRLRSDRTRALALSQADLRELRETSNRLQDYVEQEASFRSVVTHELATPVATISAYAHVLDASALPDGARDAVATIAQEARRLKALITRMDDLSGVDADPLAVDPRPVAIGPLLAEAAAFGRAVPGSHAVAVHADAALLDLDPTRMSQVLRNLVGNAARYSPAGSAITLAGRLDGHTYEIVINDEGPGFGMNDADRLFTKYLRGPAGSAHEGAGLGLWIVREVVRAHGGTVTLVSPAAPGARVQLRLPLTVSAMSDPP